MNTSSIKGIQFLFVLYFLLFLNTPLFSNHNFSIDYNLTKKIEILSKTKQWQRLLHFKNNISEIDDKKFFFSKNGKINPKDELQASIEKLISDKSDDENSTLCCYISRSTWILEQLPELKREIKIPKCNKIKKEIKELGAKYVTLVLASAHMNSPASAFGHTFLRIDKNLNTPLLSYAVNYAAQTSEDNGFVYAYEGLFGGYKGRYSIDPYYKKLKEYSDLEQRDIWEYTLDLTPKEIERMVHHIFEIRHFYADYFFLSENCSYNLLWLIEIAKQKSTLTSKFKYKAIPLDTLRAIISQKLVKKSTYRPSKRVKNLALSSAIKDNPIALDFAQSSEYNLSKIANLTKREKIASLELATALLQMKHFDNEINKKKYLENFLKILRSRSKLGKINKTETIQPSPPIDGHYSAKTTLSYINTQSFKARSKVAYHDIYDNDNGYIPGAYINFFDTEIEYKNNKFILDEVNVLDIKSYAIQDTLFKPISWEVSLGGKRIFNNELNSFLRVGAGVTLGDEKLYSYATVTPTIYYKKEVKNSLSSNIGLLYNPSSFVKFGLLSSYEWFDKNNKIQEIEPFITYNLNQWSALHLRYEYKELNAIKEKDLIFSWFWYY